MKYICLDYIEPGKFENMSDSERNTILDECFSYGDELRVRTDITLVQISFSPADLDSIRLVQSGCRRSPELLEDP